jgi:ketosteroid isomerase-like protein
MSQQVKEFFKAYERTNSSSDTSAIGDLYAATFMFGAANGVQAVTRENFLKVVPRMKAHLSSMGLFETQLRNVEVNPIDSKYLLANVDWRMQIRSSSPSKYVDVSATYVLMRGQDDALSIVFQIDHQDLVTLIRDQQI